MLTVIRIDNPFDPFLKDVRREAILGAYTIREILERLVPGFVEFEHPTICLVDGEPYLRARWDELLPHSCTVSFVRLAEGVVEIIIAVVILIVAVVVALTVVKPPNPAAIGNDDQSQRNGNPVYTLSGQQNQIRLNSAIECAYGRNRIYPAYAAIPYNVYEHNEQFQYSLYCLGHGYFSIESMRFEDTPVASMADVTIRVYPPGTTPDLIAARVSTSATVSNIELFGRNEDEYKSSPVPYDVCEPGEKTNKIEVDLSLPSGLFKVDTTTGELVDLQVKAKFEIREVDDNSGPLGDWTDIFNFKLKKKTLTPQRITLSASVTLGRYQIRGRRTDKKSDKQGAADQLRWEVLRAFIPSAADYGFVTLIGIKAKATNQLNNNASSRFNVTATRILPVWNPDALVGWSGSAATRNPVWAFCDVFLANYGARLSARFLDMGDLYDLAVYFDSAGIKFDYIFDSKSTVWEVAKTIARVGRGIPMLNGSLITMILDQPRATATALFNQHNIVLGSFQWNIKLPTINEVDGVEVEYVDEATWVTETVLCLIGNDQGYNPEKLKLPGCTDRQRAFREGMYHRAVTLYNKESIEFKTGLEGHLPSYGAHVMVSHDVPRWGNGGLVLEMIPGDDEDHPDGLTTLVLNNPVTFLPSTVHKVILRRKNGSAYGPVTCTVGDDAYRIVAHIDVAEQFNFDDIHERPYYLFGVENQECRRCTVVGLTPESGDIVGVKCIPYDDRVFSFDLVEAPARYTTAYPPTLPASPVVGTVYVSRRGLTELLTVYWPPVLGATHYTVDISPDNVTYTPVADVIDSTAVVPASDGVFWIRVAGWNKVRGPYSYWSGNLSSGLLPADIENLRIYKLVSGLAQIAWDSAARATSYVVTVYAASTRFVLRYSDDFSTGFTYTLADALADGLKESTIIFRVRGKNANGVSENPSEIYATLPLKPAEPGALRYPVYAAHLWPSADSTHVTVDTVNVGPVS